MKKCLLSIDWDYFIYTQKNNWGLYSENKRSLIDLWYKRYIQAKAHGEDIQNEFNVSSELDIFWNKIKRYFKFEKNMKVYVSDSHALSYIIAKENDCQIVYLFDSHSDLGYGGLASLNYEVNCSNWLGKLLKDKYIKEAYIFYSPHTAEKPEYFKHINRIYNVKYCDFSDLSNLDALIIVSAVHICRSGAWTPPWLDDKFIQFINALGFPYKMVDCPERKWDIVHISLADQINYLTS
ncbi:MAG TPA: arginase [Clostridiaceae bacterium]|nr:arginase [Clostridiaceae bacterium]